MKKAPCRAWGERGQGKPRHHGMAISWATWGLERIPARPYWRMCATGM